MDIAEKIIRAKTDFDEVYEAGKQAENDAFWDVLQNKGQRTSYTYGFANGAFNDSTFKPKYDLNLTSGNYMFAYYSGKASSTLSQYGITDLAEILERLGVKLDTSKATTLNMMFYANYTVTHIPHISFESCTNLDATFYGCSALTTIDKLTFKADGSNTMATASYVLPFGLCSALKNILEIAGVIGVSVDFQRSPLTLASATNVINVLKNYSGTDKEFTCTVFFSSTTKGYLDNAGATFNGMTWTDYLASIGWDH